MKKLVFAAIMSVLALPTMAGVDYNDSTDNTGSWKCTSPDPLVTHTCEEVKAPTNRDGEQRNVAIPKSSAHVPHVCEKTVSVGFLGFMGWSSTTLDPDCMKHFNKPKTK